MLAAGMSPNAGDYDKRTGLMLACHAGHEGVARALLEAGADPQLTDNFGGTAMLECVKVGGCSLCVCACVCVLYMCVCTYVCV